MTAEKERWAEALALERRHGYNAEKHISERMYASAKAGDDAEVARWISIADKFDQLRDRPAAPLWN
jgi:hypothetical protein